jgi:flavin-dependent dehydrogenase
MRVFKRYDTVILGAGLAGLSLCRHLLLSGHSGKILLIENKRTVPGKRQKVGESLVQVGGYYFSKVLDLEEHLFREHLLKYNLRFYWKTPGRENRDFEDYGQSYIRAPSNVCSYQLDRNKLEAHLLALNTDDPRVTVCSPATRLEVSLSETGSHLISFNFEKQPLEIQAEWVIDTSGRSQFLKRKQSLGLESSIQNGAAWCWVDGLVNIEKLTRLSPRESHTKRQRRQQGMFPLWLATNHFCGEGFWFWVIPLQGLTSLGVVYDRRLFPAEQVSSPEKLIQWACREFPLFEADLPKRRILDSASLPSYSYDCRQSISPQKWAMSGMSGRFTDPLYSPGSDLIAYYNTLIVDTILSTDSDDLQKKCELYEALMKVVYEAYVPSYTLSYDALGSQEVFTLKYSWELSIYFTFYVFPFINYLFTDSRFIRIFFRKFAQLGPINHNIQQFLSDFYRWRAANETDLSTTLIDFTQLKPLEKAAQAFYEVGLTVDEAEERLDSYLKTLKEFARYILTYCSSVSLDDPEALHNKPFIKSIKLRDYRFDPEAILRNYTTHRGSRDRYTWDLDPTVMEGFRTGTRPAAPVG